MDTLTVNATGCIFLATDTGRVMLQQRSNNTSHPRTWGFFGGKSENQERPVETLLRELQEEIGGIPPYDKILPLNTFTSPNNKFVYYTFVVLVKKEFIPILNTESDGFAWVNINSWPEPLHPGVKAQLYNKKIIQKVKTIYEEKS